MVYKQSHLHVDWCHSYITNVHSQPYIHHREETCSSPSCAWFYMAIIQGIKESHGLQYIPNQNGRHTWNVHVCASVERGQIIPCSLQLLGCNRQTFLESMIQNKNMYVTVLI